VLGLLIGFVVSRRRGIWAAGIAVVGVLASIHWWLSRPYLDPHGHVVGMGNEAHDFSMAVRVLSPSPSVVMSVALRRLVALGSCGAWRRGGPDRAAAVLLPFAAAMAVLAFAATRTYWSLTYGPPLMAFVPVGLAKMVEARRKLIVTPHR